MRRPIKVYVKKDGEVTKIRRHTESPGEGWILTEEKINLLDGDIVNIVAGKVEVQKRSVTPEPPLSQKDMMEAVMALLLDDKPMIDKVKKRLKDKLK